MKKLTKKFVLLAVLTMMLGVFAMTDLGTTATGAAPCCSSCDELDCESLPESQQASCFRWQRNCWRWCSFSC